MLVIQTYKHNKQTNQPEYKNYYATSGLKIEMDLINSDKNNNDLNIYGPITIYNIFDTEE